MSNKRIAVLKNVRWSLFQLVLSLSVIWSTLSTQAREVSFAFHPGFQPGPEIWKRHRRELRKTAANDISAQYSNTEQWNKSHVITTGLCRY